MFRSIFEDDDPMDPSGDRRSRQPSSLFGMMDSMMAGVMGPSQGGMFSRGFEEDTLGQPGAFPRGGGAVYSSSSFSYSSSVGGNGRFYEKTVTEHHGPGEVAQRQVTERDSASSLQRMAISRKLGDRCRTIAKERRGEEESTMDTLHNINEEQVGQFNEDWGRAASRALPGAGYGPFTAQLEPEYPEYSQADAFRRSRMAPQRREIEADVDSRSRAGSLGGRSRSSRGSEREPRRQLAIEDDPSRAEAARCPSARLHRADSHRSAHQEHGRNCDTPPPRRERERQRRHHRPWDRRHTGNA